VTVTISGIAARERDVAGYYTRHGHLAEAEAFDTMAEQLPSGGVPVTVGHHGEVIGQLIYGEIDQAGQVNIVAVLHDDTILKIPGPTYLSPELITVGPSTMTRSRAIADVAGLIAIALTTDPAGHGLTPIRMRPGDVRRSSARAGWPISWKSADPLLERCVAELGDHPRIGMLVRHRPPDADVGLGWVDYDGRPVRLGLRHGPGSPILNVR
jgi:hypothetical protein